MNNFFGYHGNRNAHNQKNGFGIMIFPTGAVYRGYWKNDRMDGRGVYEWGDGNRYEGNFSNGKQCGLGVYIWPTGGKYFGFWKNDKMHGKGVYVRHDGVIYEGYWRDDHQYGIGLKKIPQRICNGNNRVMISEKIIKEVWSDKKELIDQKEINLKPNIVRYKLCDCIITIDDSMDDEDEDDSLIFDPNSGYYSNYQLNNQYQKYLIEYLKKCNYSGENIQNFNRFIAYAGKDMKIKKIPPNLDLNEMKRILEFVKNNQCASQSSRNPIFFN